jgi:hypothetical protein
VRYAADETNEFAAGAVLTIGSVVAGGPSHAATLVGTQSHATGINDLVIGTTNYDVTFVDVSYNALFATTPPTFLGDATDANLAATEIGNFLTSAGVQGVGANSELVLVPYEVLNGTTSQSFFVYGLATLPPSGWVNNGLLQPSPVTAPEEYAVFVDPPGPAPGPIAGVGLPGLVVFIGSGVLVWWRRKRNATALVA